MTAPPAAAVASRKDRAPATWSKPEMVETRGHPGQSAFGVSAPAGRTQGKAVSTPGPWVERWLSAPRFNIYLAASGGDRAAALRQYEWNTTISAAVLRDLSHLEWRSATHTTRPCHPRPAPGPTGHSRRSGSFRR